MTKEVQDYVVEATHKLMDARTCSAEAKAAAKAWLDAIGTPGEAAETQKYIAELEADIVPIDMLIALGESEQGAKMFGAEAAKNIAAHGKEIKAAGAKFCDCPACSAVATILEKKSALLA